MKESINNDNNIKLEKFEKDYNISNDDESLDNIKTYTKENSNHENDYELNFSKKYKDLENAL